MRTMQYLFLFMALTLTATSAVAQQEPPSVTLFKNVKSF